MTPCVGPYSPVAAISEVDRGRFRPTDHVAGCGWVRDLGVVRAKDRLPFPTLADAGSAGFSRISYARWYANSLDSPGWSA